MGDYVVDELRFLAPEFSESDIDKTYNGIPAYQIDLDEKHQSKDRLRQYCDNLLGYKPDYVFSHVTRLVDSKGLWRDLMVLEHLDKKLTKEDKTAVLIVLSTEAGYRHIQDIHQMEADYNWPVAHREGMPDLSGGEAAYYQGVQEFNAKARNIKVVYISQFGFTRDCCGLRMPAEMEFMDIRKGSDAEFGLSIYEPFGIAQLEPLSFGGICVITNICGCAGFILEVTHNQGSKNVIIADYTKLDYTGYADIEDHLQIGKSAREQIEESISEKVAMQICSRLATSTLEMEAMIQAGYNLAKHMSWDVVVKKYLAGSLWESKHKQATAVD